MTRSLFPSSHRRVALVAALIALTGCSSQPKPEPPVPEIRPGFLAGYLQEAERPDSLHLLPPPPTAGSAAMAADQSAAADAGKLRGSARWNQAQQDAVLTFPAAAQAFSCPLGINIDKEHTPHLYQLLRRSLTDAGLSTYGAKQRYQRQRPFMVNGGPICTEAERATLEKDGSYPSGHTTVGWAWALILAEVAPERSNPLLARGLDFGQSRVVCNVHWQSDVQAGRIMGAAAVARLHGNASFLADLAAARTEVATVRASGSSPAQNCATAP